MAIRNKKPKCTPANKACGMACKPKAALCADQRKKLVTNAKKSGLKGGAAKEYVQARIDRYKKLVDNKGAGGIRSTPSATGKPSPSGLTDQQKKLINRYSSVDEEKLAKIISENPTITREEGIAFSGYISSDFKNISRTFWDVDFLAKGNNMVATSKAKADGAVVALKKMSPVTREQMEKAVGASKQASPIAEGDILSHHLSLEDAESYVAQYKKAFDDGSVVTAGKLLSTSWREGGHPDFAAGANVEFRIKAKLDGTGTGKLVDKYKDLMFEDEVLFPPDAKFKITKVEKVEAIAPTYKKVKEKSPSVKYQQLEKIIGNLEFDLALGSSLSQAKSNIYPADVWEGVNKSLKLGKFPTNEAETKNYMLDLRSKLAEESKKNYRLVEKDVIVKAGSTERYVIYKTEV